MALLNKKFDVLRGWPREGSIDEVFPVHVVSGSAVSIPLGSVVVQQSDGSVDLATTGNLGSVNGAPVWLVVEGNDDFSATFVGSVTCIKGNAEVRLDPSNFISGSYAVNTMLTFSAGKFQPAVTGNQIIGWVIEDDRAVDGTLRIFYSGGFGASL
jgi:hypothetical protein